MMPFSIRGGTLKSAVLASCVCVVSVFAEKLLFEETFDNGVGNWKAEYQSGGSVKATNGKMDIRTNDGATIWFKNKIEAKNSKIVYDVTMMKDKKVTDCNLFWNSTTKSGGNPIGVGKGKFGTYFGLKLYYAGIGGNSNSTTRFRRFPRSGISEKPLQSSNYKLKGGTPFTITIICKDGRTTLDIDGKKIFDYNDKNPYRGGWFAVRALRNHMQIDTWRAYDLDGTEEKPTAVLKPVSLRTGADLAGAVPSLIIDLQGRTLFERALSTNSIARIPCIRIDAEAGARATVAP